MINILQKIGAGLLTIAIAVIGFFGIGDQIGYLQERVNELELQSTEQSDVILGAFYPLGGKRYKLAGSGVGTTDTSVILQSLTMPISGRELAMADFGVIGYATMDPGNPSKKEFISFTGVTQDGSSDKATLTGVSRGLSFVQPYSASTTLRSSHSGGSTLIFSNSPAFYSEFAIKKNDETITGTWTYDSDALPEVDDSTYTPTDDAQIVWKKYADDLTNAGAADATISIKGIVEIATIQDVISMAAASSSDTTTMIVVPTYYFATTSQATTSVVVTHTDGLIDQNFIDLTEAYTWTGLHIFSATTTIATTTFAGDITIAGNSTTSGIIVVSGDGSSLSTTTFTGIPTLPSRDPDSDDQAARKKYIDDSLSMGHITISPLAYDSMATGTWALSANAAYHWYFRMQNGNSNDGDNITYKIDLVPGTYTLLVVVSTASSAGIIDITLDAVEIASFDLYSSGDVNNVRKIDTGNVVTTGGVKTLTVTVDGKNGSSSDYFAFINYICLWRTD